MAVILQVIQLHFVFVTKKNSLKSEKKIGLMAESFGE